MVNPNWGILQPVDVGGMIQQGYETGRQRGAENALSAYAQNPNDENALMQLAKFAPRQAMQVRQQQAQQQAAEQEKQIKMRASQGDPAAIAELAGIDWDAWSKLSAGDKDQIKARNEYLGNAALRISQMPEAQRAAAWDGYVQQGVQLGYDDLGQYVGKYNPQSVEALIANTGQVKALFDLEKPQYMTPASDEDLVNVKDPAALQAFQAQRSGGGDLEAQAEAAIAAGADPEKVRARMKELGGRASSAPGNFPGWY